MSKNVATALIISLFLAGCFGGDKPVEPTPTKIVEPIDEGPERPDFGEGEVDEEEAFEKALEEIPADAVPQFEETIDEGNADEIQGVEEGDEEWEEREAAKAAYAEELALKKANSGATNKGLEFRDYSPELWNQVNGVRSAVLYFNAEDCEDCKLWEAGVRSEVAGYADKNALIITADINKYPELAAEMKVTEPNTAMTVSQIGELMGPLPGSILTNGYLQGFIFQ